MKTAGPDSIREVTDLMVKILNSTYAKKDLKHIAKNETQLNYEVRTLLLSLLEDF